MAPIIQFLSEIFGTGQKPLPKAQIPPKVKGAVFRVTGIPLGTTVHELNTALSSEFSNEKITIDISQTTLCPSCYDTKTQIALVQFTPYSPVILDSLPNNDTYQIQLGDTGRDISIDKDFYGLTQLYTTTGKIKADVVAVCGLSGHAYGSWAAKDQRDQRKMWLRHFLPEDLPQCRTMIYGYNSKLTSNSTHTIPDFTDIFLEELKKARRSEESIVKSKDHQNIYGTLFSKTRATIFFGAPHRGLVVDDILAMLGEGSPREELVKSITRGSVELKSELKRFINYSAIGNVKIVSFKEVEQTRKLKQGPDGRWSRSGDFFMTVDSESSVLQLPDTIEESLSVEGNHSTMVKFKYKEHPSYTSFVRHLCNFTLDIEPEERYITPYSAVTNNSAHDLERILKNSAVDVNKSLKHKGNTTTLLNIAIDNGNENTVSVLLAYGADTEKVDTKGNTALHLAALSGNEKVVEVLLKSGADIAGTVIDENGFTALHLAAISGHVQLMEIFLSNGADIAAVGKDGDTPLHAAAWMGCEKSVEELLKRGADIAAVGKTGGTALHFAAHRGHEKVIYALLEKRPDIMAKDKTGYTALHFAARGGYENIITILLESGADVKAMDNNGDTPLHLAAQSGHEKAIEVLLENKANIEVRGSNGYTPLHFAAWCGHKAAVDVLLANAADIEVTDGSGFTALHLAALGGHEKVVEALLIGGAKITLPDRFGHTALHLAAKSGHEMVVEVLLKGGVDIEVMMNENRYTALHLAAQYGKEGVVEMLLKNNADILATDKDQYTALHFAAWSGYERVVEVLIKNGTDISAMDIFGHTALQLALKSGNEKVVELLENRHGDS